MPSSDFKTVIYSKNKGVAKITLNRPNVINAYNIQMRDELFQILESIRDDEEILSVILSGNGPKGFCSGADLTEFQINPSPIISRQARWERDIWGLWMSIPKPFVAALHGSVIGSGLEMSYLCDLRLACAGTTFSMPETQLGMIPGAGGTQTIPRNMNLSSSLDLMISGVTFSENEALKSGIIHRIYEESNLLPAAEEFAQFFANLNPEAVRFVKSNMKKNIGKSTPEVFELEHIAVKKFFAQNYGT
ncbi:MAG: enoyl-CoA hydratase/isomerase family protein [SAR202 cluster bacterium]|nr:enoyl-CoA hydratase/isomerase family protein [SAR202 cluster bacterium]|tara:strand:+ start:369 stop:1109 length:741 start_codon:yes stop_codon:yes gene_type:complete